MEKNSGRMSVTESEKRRGNGRRAMGKGKKWEKEGDRQEEAEEEKVREKNK